MYPPPRTPEEPDGLADCKKIIASAWQRGKTLKRLPSCEEKRSEGGRGREYLSRGEPDPLNPGALQLDPDTLKLKNYRSYRGYRGRSEGVGGEGEGLKGSQWYLPLLD